MVTKKKSESTAKMITELTSSDLNTDIKTDLIHQVINNIPGGNESLFDRIFRNRNPELYIALLISFLILLVGTFCSYFFRDNFELVKEIWGIFVPLLTLVIGYIIGDQKSK